MWLLPIADSPPAANPEVSPEEARAGWHTACHICHAGQVRPNDGNVWVDNEAEWVAHAAVLKHNLFAPHKLILKQSLTRSSSSMLSTTALSQHRLDLLCTELYSLQLMANTLSTCLLSYICLNSVRRFSNRLPSRCVCGCHVCMSVRVGG